MLEDFELLSIAHEQLGDQLNMRGYWRGDRYLLLNCPGPATIIDRTTGQISTFNPALEPNKLGQLTQVGTIKKHDAVEF